MGPHPHGGGVDEDLGVFVAFRKILIVVRTHPGNHHNLPGALLLRDGLGCERRPSAAQDNHFLSRQRDFGPAEHVEKAVNVGVIAIELSRPANQGVDTADAFRRRVEGVAEFHHLPLIGDGDIQPPQIFPAEKTLQRLRLQFNEAVVLTAQRPVDGHGPAVAQLPSQQAVNPLFHYTSA